MKDADGNTVEISTEMSERIVEYGERMALLMESTAADAGMAPWQVVLAVPAFVAMVLKRLTKKEPNMMTSAAEDLIELIRTFIKIQEVERRKEWY